MLTILTRRVNEIRLQAEALKAQAGGGELEGLVKKLTQALTDFETVERYLRSQGQFLENARYALEIERRRYHDLFEFAPDSYLVTTPLGVIREANRAATVLVNFPVSYLAGLPLSMLVTSEDRPNFCTELARLRTRPDVERVTGWEVRIQPRNRPAVLADLTVAVMRDEEERCVGLRWLIRDIGKIKQSERLAAIGQMVAGLAHESRNALQRSQACLEMLAHEVDGRPRALELIGRLQKAQDHLQHQYEEVRQFSAPVQVERRPCRLSEIWREAWAHVQEACPGLKAVLREDDTADDQYLGDPVRLSHVFRNVLENAVAAGSDAVEVRVGCWRTVLERQNYLCVSVRDNGPGIPPELRERIFEPFFTTKVHGTGLGLAVARRYVEAHGGQISAGRAPRGGAEITILLPRSNS